MAADGFIFEDVDRVSGLTPDEFRTRFADTDQPVVLQDFAKDWAALESALKGHRVAACMVSTTLSNPLVPESPCARRYDCSLRLQCLLLGFCLRCYRLPMPKLPRSNGRRT